MNTVYDYLVVGSGLFGAVFAQQARECGKSVLVLEKRAHIGGNCYSENDQETDINIHVYGTHIFHTNDPHVWRYINRFTSFNRYQHRVLTTFKNRVYSLPINLGTINAYYGLNLKPMDVEAFLASKRPLNAHPKNLEEKAISLIGRDLYEAFFKGYTVKQWGCDPKHLPANIITRLPVRPSYFDAYFDDLYQGIPVGGYTPLFERLLRKIPLELNVDFCADKTYWTKRCRKKIIYTGPIDRYFDDRVGRLGWRSVRFETEHLDVEDFQGTAVMNYADLDIPFTRIHEPKHLHPERKTKAARTVIIREFSKADPDEPYYPVNSEDDRRRYQQYKAMADAERRVVFGGRLGQYAYWDMDDVIAASLALSRKVLSTKSKESNVMLSRFTGAQQTG